MTAYILHFALAGTEAIAVRCLVGRCQHRRHRVAAWATISAVTTLITVHVVG